MKELNEGKHEKEKSQFCLFTFCILEKVFKKRVFVEDSL